jgi:hypothetical protein
MGHSSKAIDQQGPSTLANLNGRNCDRRELGMLGGPQEPYAGSKDGPVARNIELDSWSLALKYLKFPVRSRTSI